MTKKRYVETKKAAEFQADFLENLLPGYVNWEKLKKKVSIKPKDFNIVEFVVTVESIEKAVAIVKALEKLV